MSNGLSNGISGNVLNQVLSGTNNGSGYGTTNGVYTNVNTFNKTIKIKPIVRNGLILYLDASNIISYPGSGTVWTDLSGNGNIGTLTNGPTFSTLNGGNIVFDGVNDLVDIAASTSYKPNFPISVSVTFKIISFANTTNLLIKTDNPTSSFHTGISIEFGTYGIGCSYGNNTVNDASGRRTYSSAYNFLLNIWYTVVVVFPDNINCSIYINGNNINASYQSGSATTLVYAGSPASLGYRYDIGAKWFFNGNMSQVLIYNRALTQAEISQNYIATKSNYNL